MSVSKIYKHTPHPLSLLKVYLVLVTSGVYWSMLEVGLGLIAANLVACYGLLVKRTRQHLPRRTAGMFALPSEAFPSDAERGLRHSDETKMWTGPSAMVASSAEYTNTASLASIDPVEMQDIRVTQTMEMTEGGR